MTTWPGIIPVDESDMNKENSITTSTIPDIYGILTDRRKQYKIDKNAIKLNKRYIS